MPHGVENCPLLTEAGDKKNALKNILRQIKYFGRTQRYEIASLNLTNGKS